MRPRRGCVAALTSRSLFVPSSLVAAPCGVCARRVSLLSSPCSPLDDDVVRRPSVCCTRCSSRTSGSLSSRAPRSAGSRGSRKSPSTDHRATPAVVRAVLAPPRLLSVALHALPRSQCWRAEGRGAVGGSPAEWVHTRSLEKARRATTRSTLQHSTQRRRAIRVGRAVDGRLRRRSTLATRSHI